MGEPRIKSIHDDAYRVFVDILRQTRLDAGLTQTELASRLGTDQSYVSKYERAERRLDVVELRAICRACEVPLTDFVNRFENELKKRGLS